MNTLFQSSRRVWVDTRLVAVGFAALAGLWLAVVSIDQLQLLSR